MESGPKWLSLESDSNRFRCSSLSQRYLIPKASKSPTSRRIVASFKSTTWANANGPSRVRVTKGPGRRALHILERKTRRGKNGRKSQKRRKGSATLLAIETRRKESGGTRKSAAATYASMICCRSSLFPVFTSRVLQTLPICRRGDSARMLFKSAPRVHQPPPVPEASSSSAFLRCLPAPFDASAVSMLLRFSLVFFDDAIVCCRFFWSGRRRLRLSCRQDLDLSRCLIGSWPRSDIDISRLPPSLQREASAPRAVRREDREKFCPPFGPQLFFRQRDLQNSLSFSIDLFCLLLPLFWLLPFFSVPVADSILYFCGLCIESENFLFWYFPWYIVICDVPGCWCVVIWRRESRLLRSSSRGVPILHEIDANRTNCGDLQANGHEYEENVNVWWRMNSRFGTKMKWIRAKQKGPERRAGGRSTRLLEEWARGGWGCYFHAWWVSGSSLRWRVRARARLINRIFAIFLISTRA